MSVRTSDDQIRSREGVAMRPFSESLPMALLRAREATMRLFRPLLAAHELTEQQWRVLRALAAEEPLDAGELAERTFLLAPSLTRILVNLETRKLLSRTAVVSDQRRASLQLTAKGRRLVNKIAPQSEKIYNLIEEQFGADELTGLLQQLRQLARLEDPEKVDREHK